MEVDYKPQGAFQGVVKLKMPRYAERLAILRDLKIGVKSNDEDAAKLEGTISDDQLSKIGGLLTLVEKHVVSIAVKHEASGVSCTSVAELECYKEGMDLLTTLGSVIVNGIPLEAAPAS